MSQIDNEDEFGENKTSDSILASADQILIDHSENPRFQDSLGSGSLACSEQKNPLCGDHLKLCLQRDQNKLVAIQSIVSGCAVSTAAASIISGYVLERSLAEALEVLDQVEAMLQGKSHDLEGEILALSSLARFPLRHRCILLVVQALRDILKPL